MEKGHILYYPEGKHDILLGKELNDILKSKVNSVTKVTYLDLKDLRDNSQLIPGSLYRITDYQCTTTQENTQSAGHQFDIVLLALSENKLAEEGWAMMHDNIYDVTFIDGVTKKCYLSEPDSYNYVNIVDVETLLGSSLELDVEIFIDDDKTAHSDNVYSTALNEENLTYNYFQNSNLSAWKVWYCLNNDKSRFAWADDSSPSIYNEEFGYWFVRDASKDVLNKYAWYNTADDSTVLTNNLEPKIGDICYDVGGISEAGTVSNLRGFGRGVIYRLIDEWDNDVPYDFKNIQFKRKITDGQYDGINGTETWCYTLNLWYNDMCQDASIVGNTLTNDKGIIKGVCNNLIEVIEGFLSDAPQNGRQALSSNCILSGLDEDHYYYGMYNCSIDSSSVNNTISIKYASVENICLKWSSRNIIKGNNVTFMDCYNFTYNDDRGGIYIQKKRVLTES